MSTLAQRIEEALHDLGAKPADLARACGIKPPSAPSGLFLRQMLGAPIDIDLGLPNNPPIATR